VVSLPAMREQDALSGISRDIAKRGQCLKRSYGILEHIMGVDGDLFEGVLPIQPGAYKPPKTGGYERATRHMRSLKSASVGTE